MLFTHIHIHTHARLITPLLMCVCVCVFLIFFIDNTSQNMKNTYIKENRFTSIQLSYTIEFTSRDSLQ